MKIAMDGFALRGAVGDACLIRTDGADILVDDTPENLQVIGNLLQPKPIQHASIGLAVMGVSIVATFALLAYQRSVIRRTGSVAILADNVHYQSDVLLNVAVIAALVLDQFASVPGADPIFGIVEAFRTDPRPHKINLAAGIYIFTIGFAAMAKHITTTGAFYGFISHGLGQPWGMAAGLLATIAYIIITGGSISNVTIDNSVINDSTIGLTAPAAGQFTDLTALNGIGGGTF